LDSVLFNNNNCGNATGNVQQGEKVRVHDELRLIRLINNKCKWNWQTNDAASISTQFQQGVILSIILMGGSVLLGLLVNLTQVIL